MKISRNSAIIDSFTRSWQQRFLFAALSVFVFSMLANGFSYFNFYPQHDAINHALVFATSWEVSLGRFMLPLYGAAFGNITAPWMIGILSITCLTCATFLISDLFCLNSRHITFLLGGLLAANLTITEMCTTFMYVQAAYLFAFVLSTLSMYIVIKRPCILNAFTSAIILSVSMGFYQAFVATALLLLLFSAAKDVLSDRHLLRVSLRKWLIYVFTLFITLVLYIVEYKVSMFLWKVTPPDSQNSPSQLLSLSLAEIFTRIQNVYISFFGFFYTNKRSIGYIFTAANIVLSAIAIFLLFRYLVQKKLPLLNYIILLFLIVVYPVLSLLMAVAEGLDYIYFLPSYALFMLYPGLLLIITNVKVGSRKVYQTNPVLRRIVIVLVAVVLWQNIVYSNGAYTAQKLLYDRSVSITTRILDTIDETPDYVMKETPVVVIGTFNKDENLDFITTRYYILTGFQKASTTYTMTFGSLSRILGYNLKIESNQSIIDQYENSDIVQQMPCYPESGYCQMVDGSLIVKLS